MKFVIVGCGRVGSTLAENLDADGHDVLIVDLRTSAFDRLPEGFKGSAVRGDGTDEEVLRAAGAEGADTFLALTEGDNRNIMAAQVAAESLGIARVIAKINDPVRAAAYAQMGVVTVCRTNLMVDVVSKFLDLPMKTGPGIDIPERPHSHPHEPAPAARIVEAPGVRPAPTARVAVPGANREVPPAGGVPGEETGPVEADAGEPVRQQGRGFRRWRG